MNPNIFSVYERPDLDPFETLVVLYLLTGGELADYEVTGNPVSFNTNVAKPLSVLVAFTPVQAGSGDPSPENVRPITGWSGANVTRSGKNLLNPAETMDGIWYNGTHYGSGYGRYTASGYIRVEPGKKYVGTGRDSSQNQYCFFDIKKQYVSQTFASGSNPVTIPSGAYYMTTQFVKSSDEKMIEEGETATAYAPYTGQSYPVTFPETVYGGTLDAVNGVLTVAWEKIVLTGTNEQYLVTNNTYIKADACDAYINVRTMLYNAKEIICNMLKKGNGVWNKTGFPNCFATNARQIHLNIANDLIGVTDYTQETTEDVATKIKGYIEDLYDNGTPMIFVYALETPIEIPLSDITVPVTLIGDNTIWTDTNGENTIKYKKKG